METALMETELLDKPATTEITLTQRAQVAIGTPKYELDLLERVQSSCRIVEIKNVAGRNECHSAAMALTHALTGIKQAGEDAREDANNFQKAVVAEVKRLTALAEPEKIRLLKLRNEWDEKIEQEKKAKLAAEADRKARIASAIAGLREGEIDVLRACKTADAVRLEIDKAEAKVISAEIYQERQAEAEAAKAETLAKMRSILADRIATEAAEEERIAERRAAEIRLAAEREEIERTRKALEAQRIEQERIAAEAAKQAVAALAEERAAIERERVAQATEAARLRAIEDIKRRELAEAENARLQLEHKALSDAQAEIAKQRAAIAEAERVRTSEALQIETEREEAEAARAAHLASESTFVVLAEVSQASIETFDIEGFDFAAHLQRQREFSEKTFGPGARTAGVIDHIRKELAEIEESPSDITEWIDVVILALDGAWRSGASPQEIIRALVAKQTRNECRTWPDWTSMPADKAIEHHRSNTVAEAA